jgi:hypothetical protein
MKVLILGGYGVFGGRLVDLLADEARLEILVAGRSLTAAETFCAARTALARLRPVQMERRDIAGLLRTERPELAIDASGPFQTYDDPYAVPHACLAAGADYLDLADGADFVDGIGALDDAARAAGRFVLSGVSSFPVLTAAVLTEISREMEVTGLRGGIAPSPFAGVGRNVLRAVLGYAGKPVGILRGGVRRSERALVSSWSAVVAPPGHVPLKRLRFSLVEVPDLRALPKAFPTLRDLWMGAAPQPGFWHAMLSALAALRLPGMTALTPLAEFVLNRFTWGEHRGGMVIAAEGRRDGRRMRMEWHLVAEADDGPMIPSMACEGIVRAMLAGKRPVPGARSGIGALTLGDYEALFAGRRIHAGWRRSDDGPLYRQLLGDAFAALPAPVQALHSPGTHAVWSGEAEVTRAKGVMAGLVARLFGFPRSGQAVPLSVTFSTDATGRETWDRLFDGRKMRSTQEAGRGAWQHLLVERFGPFAFALALVPEAGHLHLVGRGWRIFGLPLPRWLMPGGEAWETAAGEKFRLHVEIRLPLVGPVVCYDGWLLPETPL